MFSLIIVLFFAIIVGILIALHKRNPSEEWDVGAGFVSAAGGLFAAVYIIVNLACISYQISDFYHYDALGEKTAVCAKQADQVTGRLAKVLTESFQIHEENIYEKIKDQGVEWLWAKYPELTSSPLASQLAVKIDSLWGEYYSIQKEAIDLKYKMRFMPHSPWLIGIPKWRGDAVRGPIPDIIHVNPSGIRDFDVDTTWGTPPDIIHDRWFFVPDTLLLRFDGDKWYRIDPFDIQGFDGGNIVWDDLIKIY